MEPSCLTTVPAATTVASTNASPRSREAAASARTASVIPVGLRRPVTPTTPSRQDRHVDVADAQVGETRLITALTNAAGEPTVADSPTPLAPIGWWGDGVTVAASSNRGVSHALGSDSP